MKRKSLSVVLAALFASYGVQAELNDRNGISGEVAINVGYTSQTSNLNTEADAQRVEGETPTQNKELIAPLGNLQYTFGDKRNHQVFIGTSRADVAIGTLALELGYRNELPSGMTWSVAALPSVLQSDVWQDPYQLVGSRKETKEFGTAYRLQLKKTPLWGLNFDLAYGQINIDKETSGSELASGAEKLAREGNVYYSKVEKFLPLSRTTFLMPSLKYVQRNADGSAMQNTGIGADLTVLMLRGQHQIATTVSYMNRGYDDVNPVFDKTRDDNQLKLFLAYEYQNFMNWENTSLVAFGGYENVSSNIDFYDSSNWIVATGLNYSF
ncbi:conserved hypothetical protein [Vibrio nigripulchritudo SFn27]|uniref:DUF2860 domain-containing protein n=1 Tax=Vibrio nigripulchritudo TaxID=28173 RepID=U4KHS4_9VIBR|nr:DUF2860 family protein [Vibrio nigripulchritudo]CCN85440.1 conserved hypothetical protein [Vibrio nigripulchritudo BLFn1]CCN89148.1 conserved hypothetical protein [Vibrio nigripulchritudo SFn27]CCN95068.1 conserved hypothetical protein [Vibrio nigripulchritudo ENn2]CCO42256.1 conserved hypothetical protein [Vibrio nigripulchritudo SFn135]CCO50952.1 conserved hypothetical protein [Vibrio nigripulchritudo Wn13]